MKRIILALSVLLGTAVVSTMVVAAETTLAVMNYQAVLFNSAAANDATLQLRSMLEPEQKMLQDIKQQIETRQSRLETDKDILTEEEEAGFQGEIQSLLTDQAQISARMQQAQQNSRDAFIKQFQPAIRALVEQVVAEKGYTLVVDAQAVLWNAGEPDITEDVLNAFDNWYANAKAEAQGSAN